MKRCPNCSQVFDDSYDFCLDDGTRLTACTGAEGFGGSHASAEVPTQFVPRLSSKPPVPTSDSSKWLYLAIGLLAATVVIGGIVLFFEFSRDRNRPTSDEKVRSENAASNASTPVPVKTANLGNATNSSVGPTPVVTLPQISSVRVRFAKGAITSLQSGSLMAGGIKNYVLACRAGQQLTATISASNGCIVFADGSTIFRSITRRGDNSIAVKNTCGGSEGYRLEITII